MRTGATGYIGFVKNRSPMKALTNHVVPSRSAQLLHFPMLFASAPSPSPSAPCSLSLPTNPVRISLPFRRCYRYRYLFPAPILFPACEGTANMRINRISTKLRAPLIMHSTWELPRFSFLYFRFSMDLRCRYSSMFFFLFLFIGVLPLLFLFCYW